MKTEDPRELGKGWAATFERRISGRGARCLAWNALARLGGMQGSRKPVRESSCGSTRCAGIRDASGGLAHARGPRRR